VDSAAAVLDYEKYYRYNFFTISNTENMLMSMTYPDEGDAVNLYKQKFHMPIINTTLFGTVSQSLFSLV